MSFLKRFSRLGGILSISKVTVGLDLLKRFISSASRGRNSCPTAENPPAILGQNGIPWNPS
jgi:hypothetical protein